MPSHEKRKHDPEKARPGPAQSPQVALEKSAESEALTGQAASAQQAPASVQSVQPQDTSLTGATGSLQRALLGMNTEANREDGSRPEAQPAPETTQGQHATGPHGTEENSRPEAKK